MKAIITYHSIDPSGSVVSVDPDRFRSHVDILREGDVPVVDLVELLEPTCERGVALTFDDGFQNLADVAWPLLKAAGLPATVFVATDWVGLENGWDPNDVRIPRLPLMEWSTLEDLAGEGLRVESHSRSHPRLTELDDDALRSELEGSRSDLASQLGRESTVLCYPYGDVDERVARAAADAGYLAGVTTELRLLDRAEASPFALPRLDAFYLAKPGVMERLGTSGFRRYVRFRHAGRKLRTSLRRAGLSG